MNNKILKPLLYQLPLYVGFVILFLIISNVFYGFFRLGDDTYIYLQYARSLIEHNEIAFNLGEPTYGFTSPLWIFLLIVSIEISGSYLQAPQLLTLFFSILSIIVWIRILNKFQLSSIGKYLVLLLIVIDPNLIKHSYLGMEASASFFLSSVVVLLLLNIQKNSCNRVIAVVFGFYFLIRPESSFIYIITILILYQFKKINGKDLLIMLLISFLIVIPWTIFSDLYFGSMMPTTFIAKGGGYELGSKFFAHIFDSIKIFMGNYLLIILVIIMGILLNRRKKIASMLNELFFISILSIITLICFYAIILSREIVYARYFCMVFPFIYLLLVSTLIIYNESYMKWIYSSLSIIVIYSMIITVVFSGLTKSFYQAELMEDEIATWVIENSDKSDSIVRSRIGKIGFLTERKIIDPNGIINPEIIEYNKKNREYDYYLKIKPSYFIGSFDLQILNRYGHVEVVKEFTEIKVSLPRHFLEKESEIKPIQIYKVDWY